MEYITSSAEETVECGYSFGKNLPSGAIVCFFGDLAAGKTTFIKGLVGAVTGCAEESVNSPTFTYMNIYEGDGCLIYHFDLYRLGGSEEFISKGFDEQLFSGDICCLEWSERIVDILEDYIMVEITHSGEGKRKIEIRF